MVNYASPVRENIRHGPGTNGTHTHAGNDIERLEAAAAVLADEQVLLDIGKVRTAKLLERIPFEKIVFHVIGK
jgi:hypothetical protein